MATDPPRGTCDHDWPGWWCSLDAGHDGPCPLREEPPMAEPTVEIRCRHTRSTTYWTWKLMHKGLSHARGRTTTRFGARLQGRRAKRRFIRERGLNQRGNR
jgi:hypothetical protein